MALRRNNSLLSVDFGVNSVRLLQVAGQHVKAMELPCEIFSADPIAGTRDPGGLGADLTRVLASADFQGRRCAVTLPATCFLKDTVVLPDLDEADRAESLCWEAVDRFGVEHDEVTVGALRLRAGSGATIVGSIAPDAPAPQSPANSANSQAGCEHLLMALKRSTAMFALEPLLDAGLAPIRLESAALAGLRTAWTFWSRTSHEPLAFVHIEPSQATVLLAREGELLFHREIPGVFQTMRTINASADPDAIPMEVRSPATDRRAFRWSGLADEILQCLRYVERRGAGQWPGGLITSGPAAGQVELIATLESICGVPSQAATASGVVDPLPATLSPCIWAAALGAAAIDLGQPTMLDTRRAA
ncbi:MAG: hypothetical protein KF724_02345 [Phycisphaeraceae bacterium]|nr:hypothetical protein [Phycisphaeraceae bacterium]